MARQVSSWHEHHKQPTTNWSGGRGKGRCWRRVQRSWPGTSRRTCRGAGSATAADQMAYLAGLQHEQATDPRIGELLRVESSALVSDPLSAGGGERPRVAPAVRPPDPAAPAAGRGDWPRVTSLAQQEWAVARQNADFAPFRPWLEQIVALKRREADALGYEAVPTTPCSTNTNRGPASQDIAGLFDALRRELVPLVDALTRRAGADRTRPSCTAISRSIGSGSSARRWRPPLGFDFQRGRLDTTTHPFFSTHRPGRLPDHHPRTAPHHFSDAFFGMLHEVGHGLYEQGLDPDHHGTPMGEAVSLGVHESQSRLWENLVGRSRAFWEHFFPAGPPGLSRGAARRDAWTTSISRSTTSSRR